jgi:hypothetical protein
VSIPTTAGSGAAKIQVSPWNMPKCERVLRPQQRNSVQPLVLHADDHYRYRVSGHALTVHQEGSIHFQQDGLPLRYLGEAHEYLSTRFPGRWIGRVALVSWPPRPPDLTNLGFFLWGFVKDRVFLPTLPANVVELRTRIIATVEEMTSEMLRSLW